MFLKKPTNSDFAMQHIYGNYSSNKLVWFDVKLHVTLNIFVFKIIIIIIIIIIILATIIMQAKFKICSLLLRTLTHNYIRLLLLHIQLFCSVTLEVPNTVTILGVATFL
jgi:hypothetical protein